MRLAKKAKSPATTVLGVGDEVGGYKIAVFVFLVPGWIFRVTPRVAETICMIIVIQFMFSVPLYPFPRDYYFHSMTTCTCTCRKQGGTEKMSVILHVERAGVLMATRICVRF